MTEQEATQISPATQGGNDDSRFYAELDKLDEQSIVAEIEGTTVFEDMFYVTKEGKAALTWQGIKELRNVMRQQGRAISIVHAESVEIHDHVNFPALVKDFPCTRGCKIKATAVAKLLNTGERSPATSHQPILMEVYDRDARGKKLATTHWEVDPYCEEKAVSKSKRNCTRDFVPELAVTKFYEQWKLKKSLPKQAGSSTAAPAQIQPPPLAPNLDPDAIQWNEQGDGTEIGSATDSEGKIFQEAQALIDAVKAGKGSFEYEDWKYFYNSGAKAFRRAKIPLQQALA